MENFFAKSAGKDADPGARPRYGSRMDDPERDAAVETHLRALDDEIARLRRLEAAMDRRIEEAEDERRAIAEGTREAAAPPEPE